jgi:hypothetical protein
MDKTLWGVIVGGLIAFVSQNAVEFFKARHERAKAAALVRAYLVGLLDITEHRRHVELAQAVVEQWKAGKNLYYVFHISDALRNDLIETGDLTKQTSFLKKDEAAELARFIGAMQAIRVNMALLSAPEFQARPIDDRISNVEWTLRQWFRAKDIALKLINRL